MTPEAPEGKFPPQPASNRLPSDGRGNLCGHNFPPLECPYEGCGYRIALKLLELYVRQDEGETFPSKLPSFAEKALNEANEFCEREEARRAAQK